MLNSGAQAHRVSTIRVMVDMLSAEHFVDAAPCIHASSSAFGRIKQIVWWTDGVRLVLGRLPHPRVGRGGR